MPSSWDRISSSRPRHPRSSTTTRNACSRMAIAGSGRSRGTSPSMHPIDKPAHTAQRPALSGGSPWPRTIRIREDTSLTTAEPAIAVARHQVIDHVANHLRDEVEDPYPLPARKLPRNAQHGFGFYIGLALRHKGKGFGVLRIDAELLERADVPQPSWIGTKRK